MGYFEQVSNISNKFEENSLIGFRMISFGEQENMIFPNFCFLGDMINVVNKATMQLKFALFLGGIFYHYFPLLRVYCCKNIYPYLNRYKCSFTLPLKVCEKGGDYTSALLNYSGTQKCYNLSARKLVSE